MPGSGQYSSSTGFFSHGKVIEADYGTAHAKVFIGSENFSSTSLNDNRELGLIISSHAVMSAIASTFAADWPALVLTQAAPPGGRIRCHAG